jgi:multidrug transporter EmrE-like cation transporter
MMGETVLDVCYLLVVAFANGGSFSLATVAHIEALKRVPVSAAYPVIRLNVVVVVFFSILYFRDRLSYPQIAGILLAVTAFALLAREVERKEVPCCFLFPKGPFNRPPFPSGTHHRYGLCHPYCVVYNDLQGEADAIPHRWYFHDHHLSHRAEALTTQKGWGTSYIAPVKKKAASDKL